MEDMAMRNLWRTTIGFDRLFDLTDKSLRRSIPSRGATIFQFLFDGRPASRALEIGRTFSNLIGWLPAFVSLGNCRNQNRFE
jgi:hypothetical protein